MSERSVWALQLVDECGLRSPRPGGRAWLVDRHLLGAVLLALPAWIALGLAFGDRLRSPADWWAWLSLVLVQPAAEELIFRGLLQGQLLRLSEGRRLGPVTQANLAVTAAFAALHLLNQPVMWALAVVVPSLVFGHLRERLGSVWPAFLVHAIYNGGFGVAAWLASRPGQPLAMRLIS